MEALHDKHECMMVSFKRMSAYGAAAIVILTAFTGRSQHTGQEVLSKMEEMFRQVEDYTTELDVVVDVERLKVPPMKVKMYFKQPDKVHFESDGFALLPRETVALNPGRLSSTVTVESMAESHENGDLRYLLTLRPNNDKTGLRRLFVTVDPSRWTIERVHSPLFDGRTMSAEFTHERIGSVYLAKEIVVKFDAPDVGETETHPETPLYYRPPGQLPRKGTITIRYSNYRINSGLSDEMFKSRTFDD
jgi:outer membrane lipoprotein-sorting protein